MGTWRRELFSHSIPHKTAFKIADARAPHDSEGGSDRPICNATSNGEFSVSSAYDLLIDSNSFSIDALWRLIWQWQGAERIKTCLWLIGHNKQLTNALHMVRELSNRSSSLCLLCMLEEETMLHMLQD